MAIAYNFGAFTDRERSTRENVVVLRARKVDQRQSELQSLARRGACWTAKEGDACICFSDPVALENGMPLKWVSNDNMRAVPTIAEIWWSTRTAAIALPEERNLSLYNGQSEHHLSLSA